MNKFCFRNEKTESTEIKKQQTDEQNINEQGQTQIRSGCVIRRDIELDDAHTASTREPEAKGNINENCYMCMY